MRKNEPIELPWNSGLTNLRGILRGQSPRGLGSPTANKDLNAYIQNVALDIKYSITPEQLKEFAKPYKEGLLASSPRGSPAADGSTRMSPRQFELKINLQTSFNTHNLKYKYGYGTSMQELVKYLKDIAGSKHVLFRSGNMMVDYTLTLNDLKVSALSHFQPLSLRVEPITIDRTPENSLKRFNIIRCIGSGGFSRVFLAEVNGVYVALKVIDKDFLVQNEKQIIVENERRILTAFNHPFITKVHYTIETEKLIAIALEYCSGGELFYLLKKVKRMKQSDARFYFAEVLAALQALHEKNMVYRDLKPENIILDYEGHVRLADFGLSKIMEDEFTHSFCGSAEYMAPEMLERGGHNFTVDYYCIGALLYQLVTGLPPYYSKDQNELFNNILNNTLEFPERFGLSNQIISLLSLLLIKNPQNRLGSRDGIAQIWSHPWMMGLTLEDILSKKLSPPIRPSPLEYNFDDAEFKSGEYQQMAMLEREKIEGDLKSPVLKGFYYESEDMREKRESIFKQTKGKRVGSPLAEHNFEKKTHNRDPEPLSRKPKDKTEKIESYKTEKVENYKPLRQNRQQLNLSPRNYNPNDRLRKALNEPSYRRDMPELIRYKSQGNLQHQLNIKARNQVRKSESSQNLSMRYITHVKREIEQLNTRENSRNKYRGLNFQVPVKSPRMSRGRQDMYFMKSDHRLSNAGLIGINRTLNISNSKRPVSSGRHQDFHTKRYQSPPKPHFMKPEPPKVELKRGYLNKEKLKNYFMKKY